MTDLELYALARGLVPDPNVAGDLFMSARDEAHLRHLAARWRNANGGDAPAPAGPPRLLTDAERDDALHLIPRRRARRRFLLIGPAAAAALVLTAVFLIGRGLPVLGRNPLLSEPAFTERAVAESDLHGGGHLRIYRADATPGAVTVWWEVTGSAAAQVTPMLQLGSDPTARPVDSGTARDRSGRLVGKATFRIVTAGRDNAGLLLYGEQEQASLGGLLMPLNRVADPAARHLSLHQSVFLGTKQVGFINGLTLADNYTLLEFEPVPGEEDTEFQLQFGGGSPTGGVVIIGGQQLKAYGRLEGGYLTGQKNRSYVFGPVPAGTTELRAVYRRPSAPEGSITWVPNPNDPGSHLPLERSGMEITGTFPLDSRRTTVRDVKFRSRDGAIYQGRSRVLEPTGNTNFYSVELSAGNVPPDVEITAVEISFGGPDVIGSVTLSLPR